jgi:phosphoribosylanthranilate isomerase
MPLKTFVKVGCITNLSDARYCAGMGVDMLGFRAVEVRKTTSNLRNFRKFEDGLQVLWSLQRFMAVKKP